jgi:EAL domain-containing protein (putative c-di-GMP-specific phosphodiesterase class I)
VETWTELAARFEQLPCLCVNISGHNFSDPDLASRLADILDASAIRPHQLELEMTETALVADATAAAAILKTLNGLGVRIAIDDFGTGYSSLNYLARFPIDTVRIDRSFVRSLTSDTGDASLIRAILQMCHALDLTVIAEGVESIAQYAMLREMNCDAIQGFLTGRPMPTEDVRRLLERRAPREARTARSACSCDNSDLMPA